MDLLTNAIESIQVGIEDYQKATRPRLLSSVRNIHAGILLLYKEALLRISPENSDALIKAKIKPKKANNGGIIFTGAGKNTVNINQIKERFESLGINTDWQQMNKITKIRNNVEHYYSDVTPTGIRGVIASAFNVIREFTYKELKEEPRDLLGQTVWDIMLKETRVYEKERQECNAAIENINWTSNVLKEGVKLLICNECGSDLLKPSACLSLLKCRACGNKYDKEAYTPEAIKEALWVDGYLAITDGACQPYAMCPNCDFETYIFAEDRCAYCGETAKTTCQTCGLGIPASEMSSSPFCGWCYHMINKND